MIYQASGRCPMSRQRKGNGWMPCCNLNAIAGSWRLTMIAMGIHEFTRWRGYVSRKTWLSFQPVLWWDIAPRIQFVSKASTWIDTRSPIGSS